MLEFVVYWRVGVKGVVDRNNKNVDIKVYFGAVWLHLKNNFLFLSKIYSYYTQVYISLYFSNNLVTTYQSNPQVKLNPRPWYERWERQDLQGVEPIDLPQKFWDRAKIPAISKPWLKHDLMKQYRCVALGYFLKG